MKMAQRAEEDPSKPKRKGTPLLAVMDENCTSCAGAPLCEPHCPVEGCINLLYEETPNGGLKPYRVWIDNNKCIGCQMCYSADLTKIHRHKETGEIFLEYAGRYYDSAKRPLENDKMPKKFQLELIGTDSEDRLDKKICPWDAIKMYEFEEGAKVSTNFYEPKHIHLVDGVYVVNAEEKSRLEKKQHEFFSNQKK
jgi:formate hydrogenlyase subunit 6/NADH:ubiquinone oxidoreductase subunit I